MSNRPEMLDLVNVAIRQVVEKTGSGILKELIAVEFTDRDSADFIFGGMLDVYAKVVVSGTEIHKCPGEQLQECIRVRSINSMIDMCELLEREIALLGGKR